MTAEAFAALVEAKRTGAGKWQARCPAHADRWPSLKICEGRNCRVLVHCFAGCEPSAVLAALGLKWQDVCGTPLTPEQARRAASERAAREAEDRAQRKARRKARDRMGRWEAVVNALGAKLIRASDEAADSEALTRVFHQACDRFHAAEMEAERIGER